MRRERDLTWLLPAVIAAPWLVAALAVLAARGLGLGS